MSGTVGANSLRMLGAQIAGNTGYFVSVLILARSLPPHDRGAVAFMTVSALVVSSLAGFGAAEATKVFVARRPADRSCLLSNVLLASGCGGLVGSGVVCALLLALDVHPSGLGSVELAMIVAGATIGALVLAGAAFLQGSSRFVSYARVIAAAPWLYALLLAGLVTGPGLSVRGAMAAWLGAQGAAAALLAVAALRGVGFGRFDGRLMWESVRFGLRAWLGGLAHLLNARVDQVLLGLLASQAALGTYAVAVNGSEILFYLPSAVGTALLPAVASSDPAAAVERTLRVFRAVMVVTTAAVVVAAALGPVLLPLVFGHAYADAVQPFLWLLPSAFGFTANAVFSNALLASGAPALSSLGPVVSLTIGVTLDIILMPTLGAVGAAIAASAALLSGGAAAAVAYGIRAGLRPVALIPRRADVALLASRATRRAGARPS